MSNLKVENDVYLGHYWRCKPGIQPLRYLWGTILKKSRRSQGIQAVLSAQSCPALCNPMDYSTPGSSVHAVFQARILEWVAISFSRQSFRPRDRTQVSSIGRQSLYHWATREAQTLWRGTQFIRTLFSGDISAYLGQRGEVPSSFVYRKWLTSNL